MCNPTDKSDEVKPPLKNAVYHLPIDLQSAISCRILTIVSDNCYSHSVVYYRRKVERSRSADTIPNLHHKGTPNRSKSDELPTLSGLERWGDAYGPTKLSGLAEKRAQSPRPPPRRQSNTQQHEADENKQLTRRISRRSRDCDNFRYDEPPITPSRTDDTAPRRPVRTDSVRHLVVGKVVH